MLKCLVKKFKDRAPNLGFAQHGQFEEHPHEETVMDCHEFLKKMCKVEQGIESDTYSSSLGNDSLLGHRVTFRLLKKYDIAFLKGYFSPKLDCGLIIFGKEEIPLCHIESVEIMDKGKKGRWDIYRVYGLGSLRSEQYSPIQKSINGSIKICMKSGRKIVLECHRYCLDNLYLTIRSWWLKEMVNSPPSEKSDV